jgi:glycosyltransferase involved in cell wall biosynthesis
MRLCIVSLSVFFGGAENYLLNLLQGFQQTDCRFEVIVFAAPIQLACKAASLIGAERVTSVSPSYHHFPLLARMIVKRLRSHSADAVLLNGNRAIYWGSWAISSRWKRIGIQHTIFDTKCGGLLRKYVRSLVAPACYAKLDGIVGVSNASIQPLTELSAFDHKLWVVRNGIELNQFRPFPIQRRYEARRVLNIPEDAFVVACLARLDIATKRLDDLLHAFQLMKTSEKWLVLAGEGPDHSKIEALAKRLGIREKMIMTGFSYALLIYQSADVVCLCSESESAPLALLEARACGIPVIATKVGGIPEMVSSGVDGMLVDAGDCQALANNMDMIYLDHELRTSLIEQGLQRVQQFHSLASMAMETKRVLQHVLDER